MSVQFEGNRFDGGITGDAKGTSDSEMMDGKATSHIESGASVSGGELWLFLKPNNEGQLDWRNNKISGEKTMQMHYGNPAVDIPKSTPLKGSSQIKFTFKVESCVFLRGRVDEAAVWLAQTGPSSGHRDAKVQTAFVLKHQLHGEYEQASAELDAIFAEAEKDYLTPLDLAISARFAYLKHREKIQEVLYRVRPVILRLSYELQDCLWKRVQNWIAPKQVHMLDILLEYYKTVSKESMEVIAGATKLVLQANRDTLALLEDCAVSDGYLAIIAMTHKKIGDDVVKQIMQHKRRLFTNEEGKMVEYTQENLDKWIRSREFKKWLDEHPEIKDLWEQSQRQPSPSDVPPSLPDLDIK